MSNMDMDMDIDELLLDGSNQTKTRTGRFAPKGAKMKPRPKLEPSQPPSGTGDPKKEEEPEPERSNVGDAMDTCVEPKHESGLKKEEEISDVLMEDENDVVREIDVYFNAQVDPETKLYVLQFPLRPLWRPYELDDRCEEVRVKPETCEVEVDLAVDVDSKNYDSSADPMFQMKKQTLATKWIPSKAEGYAVGVLNENKLYLNPVHAIVQLRPSMRHLVANDSKTKSTLANDEPAEVKPSVKSKNPTNTVEQNKGSQEEWVSLKYRGSMSKMATEYLHKMTAQDESRIHFSMSSHDYLDSLCPGTNRDHDNSKVPSKRFMLNLPLNERFKNWLAEGPPIHRFDALKYLAPDQPVEAVLEVLQELAVLVQGLWFRKSSLVYGTDKGLEFWAREYVLYLFSLKPIVSVSQLPPRKQLSNKMKELLNELGVERPSFCDWKLRELPDANFVRQYPSIVKKQAEYWAITGQKIRDNLGVNIARAPSKSTATNPKPPSRLPSKASMPPDVQESVEKAIQRLFKIVKVCSFQQISQRLREVVLVDAMRSKGFAREAVTAAADSIDAYPHDLQSIVGRVAFIIHGICVPKSSPDHSEYDEFRKVVIDLFMANGPNAKLKKGTINDAAKMLLKREVPVTEYQKVLQELCVSEGSAWVLRSGEVKPKAAAS